MIRFLKILNSLSINTLDDVDKYAESLFSEIDLIRSGDDLTFHSFANFEKTGEREYTSKVPLITNWPELERYMSGGSDLFIDKDFTGAICSDKSKSADTIKDFLRFESEAPVVYEAKEKDEKLRVVYSEVLSAILSLLGKLHSIENKNEILVERMSLCHSKLSRWQIADLKSVSRAERIISKLNQIELLESKDFVSFKFYKNNGSNDENLDPNKNSVIYENTAKIKLISFNPNWELILDNGKDFSKIKYTINAGNSNYTLNFDMYEEIIAEEPRFSYDSNSILSSIGFSSIEDLNSAMNEFSLLRAPAKSKFARSGSKRSQRLESPTNIISRVFEANEGVFSGDMAIPENSFRYPLGIDRALISGLNKSEGMLKVELSGSKFLFDKDGVGKEYLSDDIISVSLESEDKSIGLINRGYGMIGESYFYETIRSSDRIINKSVDFAKKYISIFEDLFSKRCERAVSSDFPFYKNIFDESKILSSKIEGLTDFDNTHNKRGSLNEEINEMFNLDSLDSKTFEENNFKFNNILDYKYALTKYIATYKYAKNLISSDDSYRAAIFAISSGLNKKSGGNFVPTSKGNPAKEIASSDIYLNIKKEIDEHLKDEKINSFSLKDIIETVAFENINNSEKIILATSKNLSTVLDSIENKYFISIFNSDYNFLKTRYSPNFRPDGQSFSPNHNDFIDYIERSSKTSVNKDDFEFIQISSPEESIVGLSNEFIINSIPGASSSVSKNYLDAAEEDINSIKLKYLLDRKKVFSTSGYKNILKGVFLRESSDIHKIIATEKTLDAFIDFINLKKDIKDKSYVDDFKNKTSTAKELVYNFVDYCSRNSLTIEMSVEFATILESKFENFDYMQDDYLEFEVKSESDKSLLASANNFLNSKPTADSGLLLDKIVDLYNKDIVYIIKEMGAEISGFISGEKIKSPTISFNDGKISLVPQNMIRVISAIKKNETNRLNFGLSEDSLEEGYEILPMVGYQAKPGDKNYKLSHISNIIFTANHSREDVENHGKNNLNSFLNIYEEIVKDIMIAEEKFIASNQIRSVFQFIKDEKVKNFVDFIFKKSDPHAFNTLHYGKPSNFPVLSKVFYKYISKILKDTIMFSALLFSKKNIFVTKSDFVDNLYAVLKVCVPSNRDYDSAFSVFCCNLMFESQASLPKKISTAKDIAEIFHSDLLSHESNFSSSGICNFAIKNKDFIKKSESSEGQTFSSFLDNIEFMQSKKFIDNSNKVIFIKLVKAFYKLKSLITDSFKSESFEGSLISLMKSLFSMKKNSTITDSIIQDSLLFGCEESSVQKIITEANKEVSLIDFDNMLGLIVVEKFKNLNKFIDLSGYSEDKVFEQNEDIYLITRSIDYISEIITKKKSYMKYYKIAQDKNKKIFEANYKFSYKGVAFGFKVLDYLDPYHFQVGRDTNCCQVLGGVGSAAAVDSFVNSEAGVLVLYSGNVFEKSNLLAQSYFHIVEGGERVSSFFILDNIEFSRQNCLNIDILLGEHYNDYMQVMYASLAKHLEGKGFGETLLGKGYTKISTSKFEDSRLHTDPRTFVSKYSDFHYRDHKNISKYFGKMYGINSDSLADVSSTEQETGDMPEDFNLSEINILDMPYHDFSKKRDMMKKIRFSLIDKRSEESKALKAFCKKNNLNFQKVRKVKLDFLTKSIKESEEIESVNKALEDRVSYIKRYLASIKLSSAPKLEDLKLCLDKYFDNDYELDYAEMNIESTNQHIDSKLREKSLDSRESRAFEELSRYKSQYYLISKTNLLLEYIILSSKDFIKKEFEEMLLRREEIIDMAKKDMTEMGIEGLDGFKIYPAGLYNEQSHLGLLHKRLSKYKDLYPNCFKVMKQSTYSGNNFLTEDIGVSLDGLMSEMKVIFSDKENNIYKIAISSGNLATVAAFYIFKKYLSDSLYPKVYENIFSESFQNADSMIKHLVATSNFGIKFEDSERLNSFVVSKGEVDLEELIKNAYTNNNDHIIKLAKWLIENKFSDEFKNLNQLDWGV